MELTERIKIVVKTLIGLGVGKKQEDIGNLLGYTNKSSFSQVLNGKVSLPNNFIDKLCELDSRLNKNWITSEEGSVMHHKNKQVYIKKSIESSAIPLIPEDAFAGFGGGEVSIMEQDIMERYIVPDFTNVDFMIRVKGSSMYPKYNSGDVIACKMIDTDTFLQWNKVHVISTRQQGVLIKRLKKSVKENYITALSDNPSYEPFDIPKDEILNIALVTGVIRLE